MTAKLGRPIGVRTFVKGAHRLFAVWGLVSLAAGVLAQYGTGPLDVVRWSTFKSGTNSRVEGTLTRVLVSEADFQAYWANSMGEPAHTAPRGIDWNKEQLIAIHIGTRNSGGYAVKVQSIKRERTSTLVVEYIETTPAKGSLNTMALTSPWVLVRMDRTAGNPVFRGRVETARTPISGGRSCGCCARCACLTGPPVVIVPPAYVNFPDANGRPFNPRVWWREFDCGEVSQIPGFGITVMRTISDMGKYWMRHTGANRTPWDKAPIDWQREMLVGINLGKQAGSGYQMFIDGVERTRPGEVCIYYTLMSPPIQPAVTTQVSSPYAVVRLEKLTDQIKIVRRNVQPYVYSGGCSCGCSNCRGR